MAATTQIEPIRKTVELECSAQKAWMTFTERMIDWWPHEAYSLSAGSEGVTTQAIVFEGGVGGRVYERMSDGSDGEWARIKVWDPPRHLVLTWHPGNPVDTEVELRFTALSDGRCQVELEHRGWENMGDLAVEARQGYAEGWVRVWDLYTKAAVAA